MASEQSLLCFFAGSFSAGSNAASGYANAALPCQFLINLTLVFTSVLSGGMIRGYHLTHSAADEVFSVFVGNRHQPFNLLEEKLLMQN